MELTARGDVPFAIDAVWAMVSDFAHVQAWHPGVLTCDADGSGVGALRRVSLRDGRAVTERLDELDAVAHLLAYSVVESSIPASVGLSGRISLTRLAERSTLVLWTVLIPEATGLTADMVAAMRAYYPSRIQDLAEALDGTT